jgi:hypothetical protein
VRTAAEGSGVKGLTDKIEQLLREGNVRRIVVRDKGGRTVLDVPVTVGLVALFFAPMMTTAASVLALAGGWRLEVEHTDPAADDESSAESSEGD